jgi:hypothetical protein
LDKLVVQVVVAESQDRLEPLEPTQHLVLIFLLQTFQFLQCLVLAAAAEAEEQMDLMDPLLVVMAELVEPQEAAQEALEMAQVPTKIHMDTEVLIQAVVTEIQDQQQILLVLAVAAVEVLAIPHILDILQAVVETAEMDL